MCAAYLEESHYFSNENAFLRFSWTTIIFSLAGTATYTSDQLRMLSATNKGIVSGTMELSVTAECEVNFRDYPNDEHTCCFTIEDKNFESKLKFDLTAPGIETEPSFRANGWNLKNTNLKAS